MKTEITGVVTGAGIRYDRNGVRARDQVIADIDVGGATIEAVLAVRDDGITVFSDDAMKQFAEKAIGKNVTVPTS